mmetsp:Transcript_53530/g.125880  ORF Transcript_53530/g.125880 Transcript_53530/m.125880 type:complete len:249 (-) Transcript_53530:18-764(-)
MSPLSCSVHDMSSIPYSSSASAMALCFDKAAFAPSLSSLDRSSLTGVLLTCSLTAAIVCSACSSRTPRRCLEKRITILLKLASSCRVSRVSSGVSVSTLRCCRPTARRMAACVNEMEISMRSAKKRRARMGTRSVMTWWSTRFFAYASRRPRSKGVRCMPTSAGVRGCMLVACVLSRRSWTGSSMESARDRGRDENSKPRREEKRRRKSVTKEGSQGLSLATGRSDVSSCFNIIKVCSPVMSLAVCRR